MLAARRVAPGGTSVVAEKEFALPAHQQPTEALPVSAEMVRRLRLLGLETLAQLRALPRSKLTAQFGPEGAGPGSSPTAGSPTPCGRSRAGRL